MSVIARFMNILISSCTKSEEKKIRYYIHFKHEFEVLHIFTLDFNF